MEIKEIAVSVLKSWSKNLRLHDIDKIVKSIERFGFRAPLVVNYKDGEFIVEAGHGRLEAAIKIGLDRLPCLVGEDDEATAQAYLVAGNFTNGPAK
jgi:ParB-like chromosome segregation protein Spo0J